MDINQLALQRAKYPEMSDEGWRWLLQQADGRQRTADKLPTFAAIAEWWYPVRLSCEQCSSELTARYKAHLSRAMAETPSRLLDLTGGYGVDTYFLSEQFAHTDYVEQDAELCRIADHNFHLSRGSGAAPAISVHHSTAEAFIATAGTYDCIYIDPARRDAHGGKVFRLADCTPSLIDLLPTMVQHVSGEGQVMIKLSPMIDISQALRELTDAMRADGKGTWEVYVVAVKNEVKEVMVISHPHSAGGDKTVLTAIDLTNPENAFVFTREEEQACEAQWRVKPFRYLYEPNAAILKSGAYKLAGARYGLEKLDVNTHLYGSDTLVESYPGRIWEIKEILSGAAIKKGKTLQANVLVRNYPLTAELLKKKLKIRDGGEDYIIGCRIAGKPTLIQAERVFIRPGD